MKLRSGRAFESDSQTDHIMKEEAERLRASVKQPKYFMKHTEAQNYSNWINRLDANQEAEGMLNKQRAKLGVPVKESV